MNTRKKADSLTNIHKAEKSSDNKNSQEEFNQVQIPQLGNTQTRRSVKKHYNQQSQKQIPKLKALPQKRKKQQIKQSKTKKKLQRKRSSNSNEVIQIDSFMDEKDKIEDKEKNVPEIQENKQEGQGFKINCEDQDRSFSLSAHVSSSEQSQCSDQHPMQKKQKKQKKGKKHSKTNENKRKSRCLGLDEENIIEARNRQVPRISYEPPKEEKVKKQKIKANFQNISKDVKKMTEMQDILMSYVVEEGMSGSYKYYKCYLKNNKTVYVKESHMITYFPRRLLQFKQRVINKVAMSTQKLNFVS